MRKLTSKQKRLISEFLDKNKEVFDVDSLIATNLDFFESLEKINNNELLYQNVNRYIEDIRIDEAYL